MSEIEINELLKWLNKQKEANVNLAKNTPDYVSYHGIYVGKTLAFTDVIEHLELLLKKQVSNI